MSVQINFKKLVRFIKSDKERLYGYYKQIEEYNWWKSPQLDFIIGIPKENKISPIGIMAHMDTHNQIGYNYRKEENERIYWDKNRKILFGKVNGDDRGGCYAIYEIAKNSEYKPYILLFDGEESGSAGCTVFINNYKKIKKEIKLDIIQKCNFLIALDREGQHDAIYYTSDNPDFEKYIEGFGFQKNEGLYSDIKLLEETFSKCGVNLSIGYLNNHSNREFIFLKFLENTINKVIEISNESGRIKPIFNYIEKKVIIPYHNYGLCGYDYNSKIYNWSTGQKSIFKDNCEGCGKSTYTKEVTDQNNINSYSLCKKCRKKFRKGKLFLSKSTDMTIPEKEEIGKDIYCDDCDKMITKEEAIPLYGSYFVCEKCAEDISEYTP